MELFDCKYRSGRAESAPQTRKSQAPRTMIAEADEHEVNALGSSDAERVEFQGETSEGDEPLMPHRLYEEGQLRNLYPTLRVPAEDDCEDLQREEDDLLLQSGHEVVEQPLLVIGGV